MTIIMRDEYYNPYGIALNDDRDKIIRENERKEFLLEIVKKRLYIFGKSSTYEQAWESETDYIDSVILELRK